MEDLLFVSGDLGAALDHQLGELRREVERVPEEHLLQADDEAWSDALGEHFQAVCPTLKTDEIWREPVKEVGVDVSRDPGRDIVDYEAARRYPGYRVRVHVPFEGDAVVFSLKPNQFTFNPPRGRVEGTDLVKTIEYARDTQPDIDGAANEFIGTVERWLGFARGQIEPFNRSIEQRAREMIAARRQRIQKRDAHLATSKIPERRPGSGEKTQIPDVIVRRPAPRLPSAPHAEHVDLEPVLDERIFEHILGVIRMQARQMEQNPGAYRALGEEDRRYAILATLNTHYEGRASAEAFNHHGKTDIIIRYDGRNLFICECKFWSGPKGFSETVDQLFRYTGWRDTKLAMVIFVREKKLTDVLSKSRETLEVHEQFVAWKNAASETERRAMMHWPGDTQRLADLNVFFVHTPVSRS